MTDLERFMVKVDKSGDCWRWTGAVGDHGYARFWANGATRSAHRWLYERMVGPIPTGLGLDHTCHTRNLLACIASGYCTHKRCVNPDHLEPVTQGENVRRGARMKRAS